MEVMTERKQTAFRLRADLLARLKIEAHKENRSLNNYVENILMETINHLPNAETMAAMREAEQGKRLKKVDMASLERFLKSLE